MSAGGGEWAWPSSLSLLYFYCNLICELLHVLIINPKGLEVHPLGSAPGHTTIFELALLICPILCMWLGFRFILNPLLVCSFLHYFFQVCNNTDLRPNMPEVTTGSRGYKQAWVKR